MLKLLKTRGSQTLLLGLVVEILAVALLITVQQQLWCCQTKRERGERKRERERERERSFGGGDGSGDGNLLSGGGFCSQVRRGSAAYTLSIIQPYLLFPPPHTPLTTHTVITLDDDDDEMCTNNLHTGGIAPVFA